MKSIIYKRIKDWLTYSRSIIFHRNPAKRVRYVSFTKKSDSDLDEYTEIQSKNPSKMARAMNLGVQAGRLAYLAGRMEKKYYANASSPLNEISKLF